jgi:hypothetical protein
MAATGPFLGASDLPGKTLTPEPGFNKRFRDAIKDLPATAGVAVVDMTDGVPNYAVNGQEYAEKHIFSLAKIVPLFVAYRLRERLTNQFASDGATTVDELVKHVKAAWAHQVAVKGTLPNGFTDFPDLKRIFDLRPPRAGGSWNFEFKSSPLDKSSPPDHVVTWSELEDLEEEYPSKHGHLIKEARIDTLSFKERLRLMIRMSDNNAAGSIASDLGLSYMLGTVVNEGFYSRAHRGLWLSNAYGYHRDQKWGGVEGTAKDNLTAGGNVNSIAVYFTLLLQKKLVDEAASKEMLSVLKVRDGIGYGSWFSRGLPPGAVTHSKVGLGTTPSEAAVVQYTLKRKKRPPVHIKYVVVALEVATGLEDAVTAIDGFIRREHP